MNRREFLKTAAAAGVLAAIPISAVEAVIPMAEKIVGRTIFVKALAEGESRLIRDGLSWATAYDSLADVSPGGGAVYISACTINDVRGLSGWG